MKMLQFLSATKLQSFPLLLLLLLLPSILPTRAQPSPTDLTRQAEASGTDVVLATIAIIRDSGVFSDDNRLLRRVAFVESRDGLDGDTFREGYNGGIWQVDERVFDMTRDTDSFPFLLEEGGIYQMLTLHLSIDWTSAEWANLRIPVISAVAARIFFEIAKQDIPDIGDVMGQADFWKDSLFNDNEEDTTEAFVQLVNELELEGASLYMFEPLVA